MTTKQQKPWSIVKEAHGEQKRKYTNVPYYEHLMNVYRIYSNKQTR